MRDRSSENVILAAWQDTLRRCGTEPAVLGPDRAVLRTFAGLEDEARTIETQLEGLASGLVVAVALGNSERWPALLLALFRRSVIPLPLGGHLQQTELDAILRACRAAALITAGDNGLVVRKGTPFEAVPAWDEPVPDFLKLTSGTTNLPRAIRFGAEQLLADCDQICATMGITSRDVNYGVIPFSHSYGFSNLLTPLLCRGIPLVAAEDRMPRAILDGLKRTGATVFPGMPVLFDKLAMLADAPPLPALRLCISAGAPLPRRVGAAFTARFGVRVHTFYGASECGGIGYDATQGGDYEDGFLGMPMGGVEIDAGNDGEGAIAVRSAAVADGYFPEPDASVLGGGRFIPADLIRRTERGMYLAGRVSDVINIAGRKLNPLEVEARLLEFPGVRQAVVFGVYSALRGEEAVACVSGEDLTRERLLRLCRERLSTWQAPRDVWIVAEIPVNERGKISRRALAERYKSEGAG